MAGKPPKELEVVPNRTERVPAGEESDRDWLGRFNEGNKLQGRGSPIPKGLRSLMREISEKSLTRLMRVAFDENHPKHEEFGLEITMFLAKITTPKLAAVQVNTDDQDSADTTAEKMRRAQIAEEEQLARLAERERKRKLGGDPDPEKLH